MPIIATNEGGGNHPLIDPGTYAARCYAMIQIGTVKENVQGKEMIQPKIRISWELPTELIEFKEGDGQKPYVLHEEFTLSLGEKANLRKLLVSWRGKEFTEEELKGFDVSKVIGAPCMLNVIHKKSVSKGKDYAKITAVSPVMKGMVVPKQINPSLELDYDNFDFKVFDTLPDFIKDKMKTSVEYQNLIASLEHQPLSGLEIKGMQNILEDPDNDDLPF